MCLRIILNEAKRSEESIFQMLVKTLDSSLGSE